MGLRPPRPPPAYLLRDGGSKLDRRVAYAGGGAFAVVTDGTAETIRLRDHVVLRTFAVGSDVTAVASNPAGALPPRSLNVT